jgi:hypothetical protein
MSGLLGVRHAALPSATVLDTKAQFDPKVCDAKADWIAGLCTNGEEMRDDAGSFRFWGKNRPDAVNAEWEFLHFEKVEETQK